MERSESKAGKSTQKYHNVISKFGWWSKAGHVASNSMKPNQDAYIAWVNLLWNESSKNIDSVPKKIHLFGVFDGHGTEGKAVSNYIKAKLPNIIKRYLAKGTYSISEVLMKSIQKVDSNLMKSNIESKFSGSTCWVAVICDKVIKLNHF